MAGHIGDVARFVDAAELNSAVVGHDHAVNIVDPGHAAVGAVLFHCGIAAERRCHGHIARGGDIGRAHDRCIRCDLVDLINHNSLFRHVARCIRHLEGHGAVGTHHNTLGGIVIRPAGTVVVLDRQTGFGGGGQSDIAVRPVGGVAADGECRCDLVDVGHFVAADAGHVAQCVDGSEVHQTVGSHFNRAGGGVPGLAVQTVFDLRSGAVISRSHSHIAVGCSSFIGGDIADQCRSSLINVADHIIGGGHIARHVGGGEGDRTVLGHFDRAGVCAADAGAICIGDGVGQAAERFVGFGSDVHRAVGGCGDIGCEGQDRFRIVEVGHIVAAGGHIASRVGEFKGHSAVGGHFHAVNIVGLPFAAVDLVTDRTGFVGSQAHHDFVVGRSSLVCTERQDRSGLVDLADHDRIRHGDVAGSIHCLEEDSLVAVNHHIAGVNLPVGVVIAVIDRAVAHRGTERNILVRPVGGIAGDIQCRSILINLIDHNSLRGGVTCRIGDSEFVGTVGFDHKAGGGIVSDPVGAVEVFDLRAGFAGSDERNIAVRPFRCVAGDHQCRSILVDVADRVAGLCGDIARFIHTAEADRAVAVNRELQRVAVFHHTGCIAGVGRPVDTIGAVLEGDGIRTEGCADDHAFVGGFSRCADDRSGGCSSVDIGNIVAADIGDVARFVDAAEVNFAVFAHHNAVGGIVGVPVDAVKAVLVHCDIRCSGIEGRGDFHIAVGRCAVCRCSRSCRSIRIDIGHIVSGFGHIARHVGGSEGDRTVLDHFDRAGVDAADAGAICISDGVGQAAERFVGFGSDVHRAVGGCGDIGCEGQDRFRIVDIGHIVADFLGNIAHCVDGAEADRTVFGHGDGAGVFDPILTVEVFDLHSVGIAEGCADHNAGRALHRIGGISTDNRCFRSDFVDVADFHDLEGFVAEFIHSLEVNHGVLVNDDLAGGVVKFPADVVEAVIDLHIGGIHIVHHADCEFHIARGHRCGVAGNGHHRSSLVDEGDVFSVSCSVARGILAGEFHCGIGTHGELAAVGDHAFAGGAVRISHGVEDIQTFAVGHSQDHILVGPVNSIAGHMDGRSSAIHIGHIPAAGDRFVAQCIGTLEVNRLVAVNRHTQGAGRGIVGDFCAVRSVRRPVDSVGAVIDRGCIRREDCADRDGLCRCGGIRADDRSRRTGLVDLIDLHRSDDGHIASRINRLEEDGLVAVDRQAAGIDAPAFVIEAVIDHSGVAGVSHSGIESDILVGGCRGIAGDGNNRFGLVDLVNHDRSERSFVARLVNRLEVVGAVGIHDQTGAESLPVSRIIAVGGAVIDHSIIAGGTGERDALVGPVGGIAGDVDRRNDLVDLVNHDFLRRHIADTVGDLEDHCAVFGHHHAGNFVIDPVLAAVDAVFDRCTGFGVGKENHIFVGPVGGIAGDGDRRSILVDLGNHDFLRGHVACAVDRLEEDASVAVNNHFAAVCDPVDVVEAVEDRCAVSIRCRGSEFHIQAGELIRVAADGQRCRGLINVIDLVAGFAEVARCIRTAEDNSVVVVFDLHAFCRIVRPADDLIAVRIQHFVFLRHAVAAEGGIDEHRLIGRVAVCADCRGIGFVVVDVADSVAGFNEVASRIGRLEQDRTVVIHLHTLVCIVSNPGVAVVKAVLDGQTGFAVCRKHIHRGVHRIGFALSEGRCIRSDLIDIGDLLGCVAHVARNIHTLEVHITVFDHGHIAGVENPARCCGKIRIGDGIFADQIVEFRFGIIACNIGDHSTVGRSDEVTADGQSRSSEIHIVNRVAGFAEVARRIRTAEGDRGAVGIDDITIAVAADHHTGSRIIGLPFAVADLVLHRHAVCAEGGSDNNRLVGRVAVRADDGSRRCVAVDVADRVVGFGHVTSLVGRLEQDRAVVGHGHTGRGVIFPCVAVVGAVLDGRDICIGVRCLHDHIFLRGGGTALIECRSQRSRAVDVADHDVCSAGVACRVGALEVNRAVLIGFHSTGVNEPILIVEAVIDCAVRIVGDHIQDHIAVGRRGHIATDVQHRSSLVDVAHHIIGGGLIASLVGELEGHSAVFGHFNACGSVFLPFAAIDLVTARTGFVGSQAHHDFVVGRSSLVCAERQDRRGLVDLIDHDRFCSRHVACGIDALEVNRLIAVDDQCICSGIVHMPCGIVEAVIDDGGAVIRGRCHERDIAIGPVVDIAGDVQRRSSFVDLVNHDFLRHFIAGFVNRLEVVGAVGIHDQTGAEGCPVSRIIAVGGAVIDHSVIAGGTGERDALVGPVSRIAGDVQRRNDLVDLIDHNRLRGHIARFIGGGDGDSCVADHGDLAVDDLGIGHISKCAVNIVDAVNDFRRIGGDGKHHIILRPGCRVAGDIQSRSGLVDLIDLDRGDFRHIAHAVDGFEVNIAVLFDHHTVCIIVNDPVLLIEAVIQRCAVGIVAGSCTQHNIAVGHCGGIAGDRGDRRDRLVDVADHIAGHIGPVACRILTAELNRAVGSHQNTAAVNFPCVAAIGAVFLRHAVAAEGRADDHIAIGRLDHIGSCSRCFRFLLVDVADHIGCHIGPVARVILTAEEDRTVFGEFDSGSVVLPFAVFTDLVLLDHAVAAEGRADDHIAVGGSGDIRRCSRSDRSSLIDVVHSLADDIGPVARNVNALEVDRTVFFQQDAAVIDLPVSDVRAVGGAVIDRGSFVRRRGQDHIAVGGSGDILCDIQRCRSAVDIGHIHRLRGHIASRVGGSDGHDTVAGDRDLAVRAEDRVCHIGALPVCIVDAVLDGDSISHVVEGGHIQRHALCRFRQIAGDVQGRSRAVNVADHDALDRFVACRIHCLEVVGAVGGRGDFAAGLPGLIRIIEVGDNCTRFGGRRRQLNALCISRGGRTDGHDRSSLVDHGDIFGICGFVARRISGLEIDLAVGIHSHIAAVEVPFGFAADAVVDRSGIVAGRVQDHILVGPVSCIAGDVQRRSDSVNVHNFGHDRFVARFVDRLELNRHILCRAIRSFDRHTAINVIKPVLTAVNAVLLRHAVAAECRSQRHGCRIGQAVRGGSDDRCIRSGAVDAADRAALNGRDIAESVDSAEEDRAVISHGVRAACDPDFAVKAVFDRRCCAVERRSHDHVFAGFSISGDIRTGSCKFLREADEFRSSLIDVVHSVAGFAGVARNINALEEDIAVGFHQDAAVINLPIRLVEAVIDRSSFIRSRHHDHIAVGVSGDILCDSQRCRSRIHIGHIHRLRGHIVSLVGRLDNDFAIGADHDTGGGIVVRPVCAAIRAVLDGDSISHIVEGGHIQLHALCRFRQIAGDVQGRSRAVNVADHDALDRFVARCIHCLEVVGTVGLGFQFVDGTGVGDPLLRCVVIVVNRDSFRIGILRYRCGQFHTRGIGGLVKRDRDRRSRLVDIADHMVFIIGVARSIRGLEVHMTVFDHGHIAGVEFPTRRRGKIRIGDRFGADQVIDRCIRIVAGHIHSHIAVGHGTADLRCVQFRFLRIDVVHRVAGFAGVARCIRTAEDDRGAVGIRTDRHTGVGVVFPVQTAVNAVLLRHAVCAEGGSDNDRLVGRVRIRADHRSIRSIGIDQVDFLADDIGDISGFVNSAEVDRTVGSHGDFAGIEFPCGAVEAVLFDHAVSAELCRDLHRFVGHFVMIQRNVCRSSRSDLVDVGDFQFMLCGLVGRSIFTHEVHIAIFFHDDGAGVFHPGSSGFRTVFNDLIIFLHAVIAEHCRHDHILIGDGGDACGGIRFVRRNLVNVGHFVEGHIGHVAGSIGFAEVDLAVFIEGLRPGQFCTDVGRIDHVPRHTVKTVFLHGIGFAELRRHGHRLIGGIRGARREDRCHRSRHIRTVVVQVVVHDLEVVRGICAAEDLRVECFKTCRAAVVGIAEEVEDQNFFAVRIRCHIQRDQTGEIAAPLDVGAEIHRNGTSAADCADRDIIAVHGDRARVVQRFHTEVVAVHGDRAVCIVGQCSDFRSTVNRHCTAVGQRGDIRSTVNRHSAAVGQRTDCRRAVHIHIAVIGQRFHSHRRAGRNRHSTVVGHRVGNIGFAVDVHNVIAVVHVQLGGFQGAVHIQSCGFIAVADGHGCAVHRTVDRGGAADPGCGCRTHSAVHRHIGIVGEVHIVCIGDVAHCVIAILEEQGAIHNKFTAFNRGTVCTCFVVPEAVEYQTDIIAVCAVLDRQCTINSHIVAGDLGISQRGVVVDEHQIFFVGHIVDDDLTVAADADVTVVIQIFCRELGIGDGESTIRISRFVVVERFHSHRGVSHCDRAEVVDSYRSKLRSVSHCKRTIVDNCRCADVTIVSNERTTIRITICIGRICILCIDLQITIRFYCCAIFNNHLALSGNLDVNSGNSVTLCLIDSQRCFFTGQCVNTVEISHAVFVSICANQERRTHGINNINGHLAVVCHIRIDHRL